MKLFFVNRMHEIVVILSIFNMRSLKRKVGVTKGSCIRMIRHAPFCGDMRAKVEDVSGHRGTRVASRVE